MCQELTVKHLYKIRWNLGILVCAGLMFSVPVWHLIFAPVLCPISWHSVHQSGQKLDMDHFESKPLLGCLNACDWHLKGPPCPWMARAGTWIIFVYKFFMVVCSFCTNLLVWLKSASMAMEIAQQPIDMSHDQNGWRPLVLQEFFVRDVHKTL